MITCPECGQEAPDDAKFCDRCGQGLSKAASSVAQSSPTRPTPLAAGASLKNGIEIVALTSQTSIENRYSAKRVRDGKTESIALRERLGPHPAEEVVEEAPVVEVQKPAPPLSPSILDSREPAAPTTVARMGLRACRGEYRESSMTSVATSPGQPARSIHRPVGIDQRSSCRHLPLVRRWLKLPGQDLAERRQSSKTILVREGLPELPRV